MKFSYYFTKITLFILMLVRLNKANSFEYDGMVQIKLEHALNGLSAVGDAIFEDRGNITVTSLRLGISDIKQKLSNPDRAKIQNLSEVNQYYLLKATVVGVDGISNTYLSVIKACMLAEAELNDIITITLDYAGRIVTVTQSIASTSTCQGAVVSLDKLNEFSTSVFIRHTTSGPSPDTASYIQKLEREREAKEKGDVKDNKSFLAKYWMYIVPVVLIMVLSSAANPETGGGVGGR